jgi:hypothetical protein
MTLNASGPISLGGTTAGQSIEVELGGGGTTMISLNDTNVRTLAGVPSGAIIMPTNFWGTSSVSAFASTIFNGFYNPKIYFTSSNVYVLTPSTVTSFGFTVAVYSTSGTGTPTLYQFSNSTSNHPNGNFFIVDSSNNIITFANAAGTITYPAITVVTTSGFQSSQFFNNGSATHLQSSANIIYNSTSNNVYTLQFDSNIQKLILCQYSSGTTPTLLNSYALSTSGGFNSIYVANTNSIYSSSKDWFVIFQQNTSSGAYYFNALSLNASTINYGTSYNITGMGISTPYKNLFLDPNGYLYIAGNFSSSSIAIAKINALTYSTTYNWGKILTQSGFTIVYGSCAGDSSGNVYTMNVAYEAINNLPESSLLSLFKYNTSGTLQWQREITLFYQNNGYGYAGVSGNANLTIGTDGYIYLTIPFYNNYYNVYNGIATLKLPVDGSIVGTFLVSSSNSNAPMYVNITYGRGVDISSVPSAITTYSQAASSTSGSTGTIASQTLSTPTLITGSGTLSAPSTTGSVTFTSAGTYSWICPSGVTSVSVLCIGGGGGGYTPAPNNYGGGGGGGGLGYKNNYSVTPGNSYTVVVGLGGGYILYGSNAGGDSYFVSTSVVKGGGGGSGTLSSTAASGGTYVGDGGGNGGNGGAVNSAVGGGGGAGGYSGNGGRGASGVLNSTAGSGGGAGGGYYTLDTGHGGGGVYVLGQGSNGSAGTSLVAAGGGSGGGNGDTYSSSDIVGAFGGGGGGGSYTGQTCCCSGNSYAAQGGASGAVRIMWPGSSRSFPSTSAGLP